MIHLTHQRIHNLRNRYRRCSKRITDLQLDANVMESAQDKSAYQKETIRHMHRQTQSLSERSKQIEYLAMVNGFSLN